MTRNGLTSITIENFKGIGAPVTVPLRPITLLFGANSAGKSTIIQALQYAWEVLENRNPDVDRTRIGGEVIDLGGFRNLVHQHDLERSIAITLEYGGAPQNTKYLLPEIFHSDALEELRSDGGEPNVLDWIDVDRFSVRIVTAWDAINAQATIAAYEIGLNGEPFGRIATAANNESWLCINSFASLFDQFNDEYKDSDGYAGDYAATVMGRLRNVFLSAELFEWLPDVWEGVGKSKEQHVREDEVEGHSDEVPLDAIVKELKKVILVDGTIPEWGRQLSPTKRSLEEATTHIIFENDAISVLSQLIVGTGETILEALRGLRYLGPLREVPDRLHAVPLKSESARWANGLGAWDALVRSPATDDSGMTLVERCSDYLHDTLGIPYKLRREDRIPLPAEGELFARLRLMASRFEEVEGPELQRLVSEIESLPRTAKVQLHDEKNGIDVNPMDIGVGVSQTLPVVVGAVEPNCTVFAVEQPELHIHPAVQVQLGDVFLKETLEPGKKPRIFLLETHSEHLVLRIMRRVRESSDNELPTGFPQVTPEDVAILYVEPSESGTQVVEIPINKDGEFDRPWPKGFFTERVQELM